MKHGIAFRKFSRTSSHRMLMLRNLVTSLFEHEQIKTTLPKARDTARLAEKIITLAKKGDQTAYSRAESFILKPEILPKLFGPFASRYSARPGGYTRIHRFGNRPGDNAPHAVLELVDNPRDLRYEMTSRAIGREVLQSKLNHDGPIALINKGMDGVPELIESEKSLKVGNVGQLRSKTRWNLQKVLKFRGKNAADDIGRKAGAYADELLASPLAFRAMHEERAKTVKTTQLPVQLRTRRVGQTVPGQTRAALDLSKGALGQPRSKVDHPNTLTLRNMLGRKFKNAQA